MYRSYDIYTVRGFKFDRSYDRHQKSRTNHGSVKKGGEDVSKWEYAGISAENNVIRTHWQCAVCHRIIDGGIHPPLQRCPDCLEREKKKKTMRVIKPTENH